MYQKIDNWRYDCFYFQGNCGGYGLRGNGADFGEFHSHLFYLFPISNPFQKRLVQVMNHDLITDSSGKVESVCWLTWTHKGIIETLPERIYNPITAMGFSAMFTFQLDNTKR